MGTSFKMPFLSCKFGREAYPSCGLLLSHCTMALCWHGCLLHWTESWESRLLCIVFTASPRPATVPATYLLHKWTNETSGTNGKNEEIWTNLIPYQSEKDFPLLLFPSYPLFYKDFHLGWTSFISRFCTYTHCRHIYSIQTCQSTCWPDSSPEASHFPEALGWNSTHSFGHSFWVRIISVLGPLIFFHQAINYLCLGVTSSVCNFPEYQRLWEIAPKWGLSKS